MLLAVKGRRASCRLWGGLNYLIGGKLLEGSEYADLCATIKRCLVSF